MVVAPHLPGPPLSPSVAGQAFARLLKILGSRRRPTYIQRGDSYLFVPLTDGRKGLADIVEFLDLLEAIQFDDSYPPGCLIINDLATPANEDVTNQYLAAIDTGLKAAIERSNRTDNTDPRNNSNRRESLLAAVIGANLTHRRDPTTAAKMMDGLRWLVESWANS